MNQWWLQEVAYKFQKAAVTWWQCVLDLADCQYIILWARTFWAPRT